MMESQTIGFNDDVLMEVLAFLPPKSVFRFKSVSPHWRDLLSSPAFLRRYAAVHRHDDHLVAFFQKVGLHETSDTKFAKHCNVLPRYKDGDYIKVPKHVGRFLSSSNGLVLCRRSRGTVVTYHVGNPLTGKFVELPLPWHGRNCLIIDNQRLDKYHRTESDSSFRHNHAPLLSAALICKKSNKYAPPVYTVLRAGMHYSRGCDRRILHIDSYSSESGKWTRGTKKLIGTDNFELSTGDIPVVANGVVHWYTSYGDIAVYDPECGDQHIQLIMVPRYRKDRNICYAVTRSTDDDVLWLAILRRRNLLFYMLPKEGGYKRPVSIDSKEWVLMRDVSISSISKLMKKGLIACEECTLECLIPESGSEVVAVLQQEEKVFLYNVHRESIDVKLDYSNRCNLYFGLCPYLQSSFLSSYCL